MGWFRNEDKEKIPEKLRGKSAEEIVAATEKAEALELEKAQLIADKAASDAKVTEHTTALETMREQVRRLEMNQKPPEKKADNEPIDFALDPEGAINERIRNATTPVAMALLQSNSQFARMTAKQQLDKQRFQGTKLSKGAIFEKFSADIDKLAKQTPVNQLQAPDSWIYLFNMVVGQHMDEIVSSSRDGKFEQMFSEPGADGGDRQIEGDKKDDQPSPDEIRIAKRMGITIDKYMANKKAMVSA